jgi:hypothetical protein
VTLKLQKPSARQRADLGAAKPLEQLHAALAIAATGGRGADEHEF